MLGVGLDGFRRIVPAHVGCRFDLVGSRRMQSDRLDDQRDDQGAFDSFEWHTGPASEQPAMPGLAAHQDEDDGFSGQQFVAKP